LQLLIGSCCPLAALHGISQQLMRAVAELHGVGLVHGDIKPSNVLWSATRAEVKLGDFGLTFGTVTHIDANASSSSNCEVTGALHPVSSSGYRAPEAEVWNSMSVDERRRAVGLNQKPCGPATDAWSCGVVLCELFSGERLWPSSLASVVYSPELCDRAAAATTPSLAALSAQSTAEAHSRWRRQVERARELLNRRGENGKSLAAEAKCLHFGTSRVLGDDLELDEEHRSRSFTQLVLAMLRFHTVPPLMSTSSDGLPATQLCDPTASATCGAAQDLVASTQDDCLRVAPKGVPALRLGCARALTAAGFFAAACEGVEPKGGGGVLSTTTEQQQQHLWAWPVSLLPSRFLLVHGLLAGNEVCMFTSRFLAYWLPTRSQFS
jgi:serine/threonine protein kinase